MLSPPVTDLCVALADILPVELSKFIFLSTGSETVECALKMAKMYTGRWEVVGFSTGYRESSSSSEAQLTDRWDVSRLFRRYLCPRPCRIRTDDARQLPSACS
jgi:4-aminobutyrate aminotransferase-like enzyme